MDAYRDDVLARITETANRKMPAVAA